MSSPVPPVAKPLFKSKTIWWNLLLLVVGLAGVAQGIWKDPIAQAVFVLVGAIGNGIIRKFGTKVPIG